MSLTIPVGTAEWHASADAFLACAIELNIFSANIERDDHRPLDAYPAFPPRTCHWAAWALAGAYPELTAVTGELVFVYRPDGTVWRLSHSWNLRADGAIVDSALPALPFSRKALAIVYVPDTPDSDR